MAELAWPLYIVFSPLRMLLPPGCWTDSNISAPMFWTARKCIALRESGGTRSPGLGGCPATTAQRWNTVWRGSHLDVHPAGGPINDDTTDPLSPTLQHLNDSISPDSPVVPSIQPPPLEHPPSTWKWTAPTGTVKDVRLPPNEHKVPAWLGKRGKPGPYLKGRRLLL